MGSCRRLDLVVRTVRGWPERWCTAAPRHVDRIPPSTPVEGAGPVFGGRMGNPNPWRQSYRCYTCGEPRPPYQFYCDRHQKVGELYEKPLLVDRIMRRLLGRRTREPQE